MEVKYINSNGKEVNLNKYPYRMLVSDLLDYEWGVIGSANTISGFQSQICERSVLIDIWKTKEKSSRVLMNELTDIFEFDIAAETPGRLYIDDSYILCYIYKSQKSNWETELRTLCEYGIIIDKSRWVTETKKSFMPSGDGSIGLDYPHDYPYDYAPNISSGNILNDNYAPADFRMTIYGPAIDPMVTIGNNIYQVYTELKAGEYLVIDSQERLVEQYDVTGGIERKFNSRNKKYEIYASIPPGSHPVIWSEGFGFDLIIYMKRSEPKWIL